MIRHWLVLIEAASKALKTSGTCLIVHIPTRTDIERGVVRVTRYRATGKKTWEISRMVIEDTVVDWSHWMTMIANEP